MATEKRLIYLEDAIAVLEKDVSDSKDALKTAYHGDKAEIKAEMNGVRAAIHLLKHHASHGGTVDAAPVVHGQWIPLEYDGYADGNPVWDLWECSECREEHSGDEDTLTLYCPNCGAKMDGERRVGE